MARRGAPGAGAETDRTAPVGTAGDGSAAKLRVQGLGKKFVTSLGLGRQRMTVALDDVSLDVREGEFVSVIGPSGCGKSTLLMIVAGLTKATEGAVSIDGRIVTSPGPDRGVVFQSFSLFPWLKVKDNIRFAARKRGLTSAQERELVDELLELVSLGGFADYQPLQLSGGMQQRVAIARALASDPEVMLMDEPFGALDAQTRLRLQVEFERVWNATRKTVLFVTHDVAEAVTLSDVVVVMSAHPGRVLEVVPITLPRPRDRFTAEFGAMERRLTGMLDSAEGTG